MQDSVELQNLDHEVITEIPLSSAKHVAIGDVLTIDKVQYRVFERVSILSLDNEINLVSITCARVSPHAHHHH